MRLMINSQVRSGMFSTSRFPFKYGWFVTTACQEVVSRYCITTGQFPGGQNHDLHQESRRVGEISNMFDILWIHCNKLGNYN